MRLHYIRCLVKIITFIVIAGIYALHINFPVIDLVGQGCFQKCFDLQGPDRTAFHCHQIVLLIHLAPVNDLTEFLFQNCVKLEPGASAVAFPERVSCVHLHMLFNNLVKGGLRHLSDMLQCCL